MSSKVKLLLYWKSIVLSLILHQALSSSIRDSRQHCQKTKVGDFQDLAHLSKKQLDLYLCKRQKIMEKVIMENVTYGKKYLWQKYPSKCNEPFWRLEFRKNIFF